MRIALVACVALLFLACPSPEGREPRDGGSGTVGGLRAVVDPETGELTSDPLVIPPSSLELFLSEESLSTSDEGLFEEELPDGTVMLDPQGRYKSGLRVRIVGETVGTEPRDGE